MRRAVFEAGNARLVLDRNTLIMELPEGRPVATSRIDGGGITVELLDGKTIAPTRVAAKPTDGGLVIEAVFKGVGVVTVDLKALTMSEGALAGGRLGWKGDRGRAAIVHWRWKLENRTEPFFLIPGVLYGTNNIKEFKESPKEGYQPQLAYRNGDASLPESPLWHVRADRSPAPFVSANFEGAFVALGIRESHTTDAGEWGYNSLGVRTDAREGDHLVITLGGLDAPARPVGYNDELGKHEYGWSKGPISEPVTGGAASAEVYLSWRCATDRFAYVPFHRFLHGRWHERPRRIVGWRQALADLARPLGEEAVCPETGLHYTLIAGTQDGETVRDTLIGFCGGLPTMQSMLEAGRVLDDGKLAATAAGMIDKIVREAPNPKTGFFFDGYQVGKGWTGNYWREDEPHSAYSNGHAAFFLTRAHLAEKARGYERPSWLAGAASIVAAAVKRQLPDDHFPTSVSTDDGAIVDPEGFAGCWLAAAAAIYACATGDAGALAAAERACEAYWKDLATLEVLGAPIDTGKVPDEESMLPFVKLTRMLHEQTGNARYLKYMGRALDYLFTWKFSYNTHHRAGRVNWSSSGGDITSTHNIHIHAMGNVVAGDMRYFADATGSEEVRSRLVDTLLWGIQLHNRFDGELGFGRKGWLSEQYYHTAIKYQIGEADGGVWLAYLPWCAGVILNSLTDGVSPGLLDEIAPPLDREAVRVTGPASRRPGLGATRIQRI